MKDPFRVEENDQLDRELLRKDLEEFNRSLDQIKEKQLNSDLQQFFSVKKNLIDEVHPFASFRKKGYYTSDHYELRIRDLTETTGTLVFFDHEYKLSDMEKFSYDKNRAITKQLKKPCKKMFRRLKKELR